MQKNEALYSLDEKTGKVSISLFEESNLNRYIFVGLGEKSDVEVEIRQLAVTICEMWEISCTDFIVRPHYTTGDYRIRSLVWISRMKKLGWDIYQESSFTMSEKRISCKDLQDVEFHGWNFDESHLLFLGEAPNAATLVNSTARPSLELFARHKPLAPSRAFLSFVAKNSLSFAYSIHEEFRRWGFIIVTRNRLNIQEIQNRSHLLIEVSTNTALW